MHSPKQKTTSKQKKLIAIIVLVIIAAAVIYLAGKKHVATTAAGGQQISLSGRPLPELSTAQKRINSYTPAPGDLKYRIAQKPVISSDPVTSWNVYQSVEYNYSFLFPTTAKILDNTEALGYQLPPNLAYKGSRDNFQIVMQGKNNAYFLLFMNDPSFNVANSTITATSVVNVNGLKMTKQILANTDPQFASSQGIYYNFQNGGHNFIWYGTFDGKDVESINDFQSMVESMKFK